MNQEIFSNLEIDTIGEIMNISMGAAATAASTLLDNKVSITTPVVEVIPTAEFDIRPLEPALAVEIKYVEGITGSNILILKQSDVRTILGRMMLSEIPEEHVIDEMAESAICELMNQMMGSSATVLSCFLGRAISISTPTTVQVNQLEDFKREHFPQKESLLTTKFTLTIQDVMESEFVSVMDIDLAREIIDVSLNFDSAENTEDVTAPPLEKAPAAPVPQTPVSPAPFAEEAAPPPPVQQVPPQAYVAPAQQPYYPYPPQQPQYQAPPQGYAYAPVPTADPIKIREYDFNDFSSSSVATHEQVSNLDLVMNVPVVVTVELGRTKRKIKEILEFGQGTIVELDKQAGTQVDVIVNGQLIARGDVVVVDDNFSIRITEILKNRDSITML